MMTHILLTLIVACNVFQDVGGEYTVRLFGGDGSGSMGVVQAYVEDEWCTFYGYSFTINDAQVVCRMLGFNDSDKVAIYPRAFGVDITSIHYEITGALECHGYESNIEECQLQSFRLRSSSSGAAAINCNGSKLRLVDGDSEASGRVEIYLENRWYSICVTGFGDEDAEVVCRALGYGNSNVSKAFAGNHFGSSGDIIVANLDCDGTQTDLLQCDGNWGSIAARYCSANSGAGVTCGGTSIRLVDGPSVTSGRLEVFHGGRWGTVCSTSSNFNWENVQVICRMLGVDNPTAYGYAHLYGDGYTHIALRGLSCSGSEIDIANCKVDQWVGPHDSVSGCNHNYDIGVNCDGETEIRLVDGDSEGSGRLEIRLQGDWGTVADRDFDDHDLRVVCRMLGYEPNDRSFYMGGSYYGQGVGKVLVSNLACDGDELDIGQCQASWLGTSVEHSHDVGVSCDGEMLARVVGGSGNSSGRVEVFRGTYYRTICSNGFDRPDLVVVCRMLGFEHIPESASWTTVAGHNRGLGVIGASDLQCDGSEANVGQCVGHFPATSSCSHDQDVYVNCMGDSEEVRLVGGATKHEGRVEVNISGKWGIICDRDFTREDAVVVCRILGYSHPEDAVEHSGGFYGSTNSSTETSFYNLQCHGMETNLMQCLSSLSSSAYCTSSYKDVGVNCCPTDDCEEADLQAIIG